MSAKTTPSVKGHWPRGKRRNDPGISDRALGALLARAQREIEASGYKQEPHWRGLARACGVADRTARRWAQGINTPSAIHTIRMRGYLDHHK